jgi:hypothetical protein
MVRLVANQHTNMPYVTPGHIVDYMWMIKNGATPREAANRVGCSPKALARWFHRHGDREHANPLSALEQRERRESIRKGPLKYRVYDENGVKL